MNTSTFFDIIFQNARQNAIIVVSKEGLIEDINNAFTISFGFGQDDLKGKRFEVLFSEKDRLENKPEIELETCKELGSAKDENYLMTKDGTPVWVNGESVCVKDKNENLFFIKIIQNLHAKKELERFLTEAYDFIDNIFDSVKETAFIIVDSRLRVVKSNKYFTQLFKLKASPAEGGRLTEIENNFWKNEDVRHSVINCLVTNSIMRNKTFQLQENGTEKDIIVSARILEKNADEKHILIVINKTQH